MRKRLHQATNIGEASTASLVETALQIAEERKKIVEEMRRALLSNDDEALKQSASKLCGVEND